MANELVEIARVPTATEAAMICSVLETEGIRATCDSDAVSQWFWHFGTEIVGTRVIVRAEDVERACRVIDEERTIDRQYEEFFAEDPETSTTEDSSDELTRAWRASVVGIFLMPPVLNVYSCWLLLKNGFFAGRSVVSACRPS